MSWHKYITLAFHSDRRNEIIHSTDHEAKNKISVVYNAITSNKMKIKLCKDITFYPHCDTVSKKINCIIVGMRL